MSNSTPPTGRTTTPRQLRIQAGLTPREFGSRLHITLEDVRTLEATPLRLWDVAALQDFLQAIGMALEITAVGSDGTRHRVAL